MTELLPLWMVAALMIFLFSGYPVALVLIGVTVVFTAIGIAEGMMTPAMMQNFSLRVYGIMADNIVFPAVPPLIFMGVALARSGQVADLLGIVSRALRRLPGHLPVTVLLIGVIIAPSAGLVGAAVSILALTALPAMLQRGYDPTVATASVAAAGTLGVILPPALMLFFLADLIGIPILGAFTGILWPAAALLALYAAYFIWRGQPATAATEVPFTRMGLGRTLIAVVGPISVIGSVLASIAAGWATPSQSGAFGALAAFLLMAVTRTLTWPRLREVLVETAHVTAMVFLIIIAANAFSFVFRALDGDELVFGFLAAFGFGEWGKLLFILSLIFVLGFFIDWLEIVLITLPIFMPVIEKMDFAVHVGEPLFVKMWIATTIAIVLQTSFLTPPFGFALFFLRGAAPPGVRMADIYRGVIPIVALQLVVLALVLSFPWLATALPRAVLD